MVFNNNDKYGIYLCSIITHSSNNPVFEVYLDQNRDKRFHTDSIVKSVPILCLKIE